MKTLILAGGRGSRISEESHLRPKPMIEINNKPLIWHIMKIYSFYGINDFIILAGYKSSIIVDYFLNYTHYNSDFTIDISNNDITFHTNKSELWKVTVLDTGLETMTGGRIKRAYEYIKDDPFFCLTYGDGLANIDINTLVQFHKSNNVLATLTAVKTPPRFGSLEIINNKVSSFKEKPIDQQNFINGGFFVLSPKVINYIEGDQTAWEEGPLQSLTHDKQVAAYKHKGFWQPMDTMRDKELLETLSKKGLPPWFNFEADR